MVVEVGVEKWGGGLAGVDRGAGEGLSEDVQIGKSKWNRRVFAADRPVFLRVRG